MFRLHPIAFVLISVAMALVGMSSWGRAQQPPESLFPAPTPAVEEAEPQPERRAHEFSPQTAERIEQWLHDLGSDQFALRERAATRLMEIGPPILSRVRRIAQQSDDPEIRLRAGEIVRQLTHGDMEAQIEAFLAGDDVNLEGWRVAAMILGDSAGIRELYVDMMRDHPTLTAALEGTPRDRAMAMDAVMTQVQNAMFVQRKFPTRADAFALLLPAIDPNVPLNTAFESVVLSVLQKDAVSKIQRDAQLVGPFKSLLGRWMTRSTLGSRDDVLLFGMSWDIEATLPIAIQTLGEANQTETLAFALQAIARFGTRDHVAFVVPLLDDTRPASERGFARPGGVATQLGDVAMAAIATLYDVPLSEIGFAGAEPHPTYAFLLTELRFGDDADKPREAARAKIDALLEQGPTPNKGS